ncbi:MAG: TIGR02449 family protein [Gammaproteobacteria bacterium]|nr:TIGR02449 family protein [Gammaproteobacteria bacterium]MAY01963.1 TIGR02449 family protein [Gammaproteobacteria bacterium]|tara:strand:- start:641 stop:850 length:210 start_codon:yes stop_codon:yes gene_type:complete
MSNSTYSGLEEKVDELIQLCAEMKAENQALRDETSTLQSERKALHDKNQLARVRLEKVLRRLKTLEQGS